MRTRQHSWCRDASLEPRPPTGVPSAHTLTGATDPGRFLPWLLLCLLRREEIGPGTPMPRHL